MSAVSTKFYRPELDALRACAFLMVFLHHSLLDYSLALLFPSVHNRAFDALGLMFLYLGQGCAFGVGLFFTLSAYLISTLLLIERRRAGRINFKAFYVRRALRIWPLYFVFILLVCPLIGAAWREMAVTVPQMVSFLLFSGNWFLVAHGFNGSPINFLWSVCQEEQFYVVWPVVVAWRGARSLLASCAAILLASVVSLIVLGHLRANLGSAVWCNSLVQCMFFAAGGLLALLFRKRVPAAGLLPRFLIVASGLALLSMAAATTHIKGASALPAGPLLAGYMVSLAGVITIFIGFLGTSAHRIPNWLRHLGRISYGLYVFHVPCISTVAKAMQWLAHLINPRHSILIAMKAGTPLLCLAATVGVAHISYALLEAPFLRIKDRFTVVRSREV